MLRFLFAKRCPACRSYDIAEVEVFTLTYYIFYHCRACDHDWKESGL